MKDSSKSYYDDYWCFVCFFIAEATNYEYLQEMVFIIKDNQIKLTAEYKHDYDQFDLNTITQVKADRGGDLDLALVCIVLKASSNRVLTLSMAAFTTMMRCAVSGLPCP